MLPDAAALWAGPGFSIAPAGSAGFERRERPLSVRQREVLDMLIEIFSRTGLDLTVGELARRVRCSRRTLYELAPSKEELFMLALDRMMSRLGRRARSAAREQKTPEQELEVVLAASVEAFGPLSAAFMEALDRHPPAGWLFRHHLTLVREFLVHTVERGIAAERFRAVHPELAAEALIGAVTRVTNPQVLQRAELTAAEALEEVFGLVVHGLVHPSLQAPPERAREGSQVGPPVP